MKDRLVRAAKWYYNFNLAVFNAIKSVLNNYAFRVVLGVLYFGAAMWLAANDILPDPLGYVIPPFMSLIAGWLWMSYDWDREK